MDRTPDGLMMERDPRPAPGPLTPPASTGRPREVSWSELDSFHQCPRKYLWKHREKRKGVHRFGPQSFVGRVVHETLADVARLPAEHRTKQRAETIMRDRWRSHTDRSVSFASREEEGLHGSGALESLAWVLEQEDLARQAFAVETWCKAPLDDGLLLGGKLDRVDRLPDGRIVVTDYKTGRVPPPSRMPEVEIQLRIYALLAAHAFGGGPLGDSGPVSAQFVYLEARERHLVEPTATQMEETAEDVRYAVMRVDSECDFLPTPTPLCGWCDYLEQCDAGQAWSRERASRARDD